MKTLEERFDQFDDEYLQFDRIENKRSKKPDVHAFMLLDELVDGNQRLLSEHGDYELYLSPNVEELNKVITDDQILELVRCGIRYCEYDCLSIND